MGDNRRHYKSKEDKLREILGNEYEEQKKKEAIIKQKEQTIKKGSLDKDGKGVTIILPLKKYKAVEIIIDFAEVIENKEKQEYEIKEGKFFNTKLIKELFLKAYKQYKEMYLDYKIIFDEETGEQETIFTVFFPIIFLDQHKVFLRYKEKSVRHNVDLTEPEASTETDENSNTEEKLPIFHIRRKEHKKYLQELLQQGYTEKEARKEVYYKFKANN